MDLALFMAKYAPKIALRLDVQRKEMLLGPPKPGEEMMVLRSGFGCSGPGAMRRVAPAEQQTYSNSPTHPMILILGSTDRYTGEPSKYLLSANYWFLHAVRWPQDEKERKIVIRLFEDAAWERHYFDMEKGIHEEVLR